MKKIVSIFILLVILNTVSFATDEVEQMQQQTNQMINSIEMQVLDKEANNRFVYAMFIVVGISMIFEYFVKNYKYEIRNKKEEGNEYKDVRKKLWIVYGIHFIFMLILGFVLKNILAFTDIYVIFLLVVTFYIVEFAPLFNFSFWKKKKEEKR